MSCRRHGARQRVQRASGLPAWIALSARAIGKVA
jgi:hypothetical protein